MNYWLDLFSPETLEAFSRSDGTMSEFHIRQRNAAEMIGLAGPDYRNHKTVSQTRFEIDPAAVASEVRRRKTGSYYLSDDGVVAPHRGDHNRLHA